MNVKVLLFNLSSVFTLKCKTFSTVRSTFGKIMLLTHMGYIIGEAAGKMVI